MGDLDVSYFYFYPALKVFKWARSMEVEKLMVFHNMTYVQKNWDSLPIWNAKGWRHGGGGKGKWVANAELWAKIYEYRSLIEVRVVADLSNKLFLFSVKLQLPAQGDG